jgi:protoporphyrinogen oxidase
MTGTPFEPWTQAIVALFAAGGARGWVSRGEAAAALGVGAPAALVEELVAALQARGIEVEAMVEGVLLDVMTAAVKRLVERGEARGYITFDEVHAALPPDQVSEELVEDTLISLHEIGIVVVEVGPKDDGG